MTLNSRMQRLSPGLVAVVLGLLYRLWLMPRYAGWEESDYGNLAMVRGVLEGNFQHFDMNHMPGYYAAAAAVLAVVGDTVVAARAVSLISGLIALWLAVRIGQHLGGRRAAWWTGGLLVLQPEFALYSASSLREPLYAAFVLGVVLCLLRERLIWASALAGAAFLVRMDGALALAPVLIWHAWSDTGQRQRLTAALGPLLGVIAAWSIYCRIDHGTFAFWSHSVQVNVETGLGNEAEGLGTWWLNGAEVATTLGAWILPWRIGWGVWLGAILGVWALMVRGQKAQRTVALAAVTLLGVWLGIGLVGQHAPSHNLYWKWLCPVVPLLVPVGVTGLLKLADKVGSLAGPAVSTLVIVLCVAQAGSSYVKETERQRSLSESLYRPQLALAQWIESVVPPETPMVIDNIPACWIRRRHHERPMTSWFDVPTDGSEADFSAWVEANEVEYILWFKEQWTQAPRVAPFLSEGGEWRAGQAVFTEVDREDEYGWIFYVREGALRP